MTNPDSTSDQAKSCAERWQEALGWLDYWFQPEKVEVHDFDDAERELWGVLAPAWLEAEPGAEKLAVLDAAAAGHGRDRVAALLDRICADETSAYWSSLTRDLDDGGTLDDLVRLLWEPLPEMGFEFSTEKIENGLRFRCTRCPNAELAAELGGSAAFWFSRTACATDFHVGGAFDPPIRFERTKTLVQGDDHCNHTYFAE